MHILFSLFFDIIIFLAEVKEKDRKDILDLEIMLVLSHLNSLCAILLGLQNQSILVYLR